MELVTLNNVAMFLSNSGGSQLDIVFAALARDKRSGSAFEEVSISYRE